MKWLISIVFVGVGIVACSRDMPPKKGEQPPAIEQVDIITDVDLPTIEVDPITQGTQKTDELRIEAELAGLPYCEKSSMRGYENGDALNAAIDGFNARGDDIDKCNAAILKWAKDRGLK